MTDQEKIVALEAENARLRELVDYTLQDHLHNRLTPRVVDVAYSAFMQAKRPNSEDGGESDWYNDTRPMVRKAIEQIRKDLGLQSVDLAPGATALPESAPNAAALVTAEREICIEIVRKMVPNIPIDGPDTKEQEIEYNALGHALEALRARRGKNFRSALDEIADQIGHYIEQRRNPHNLGQVAASPGEAASSETEEQELASGPAFK